jgi:DNA polymerase-3 subunit delta
MDYRTALKQIANGNVCPVYLCYGTETFLRQEFVSRLVAGCVDPSQADFAVIKYDLAETPVQAVLEDAETLPFLVPHKVILAHNALFFTGAKEGEKAGHSLERLQAYLASPVDYSIVVFTVDADKLDERKKIVKLLKERKCAIAFPPLEANEIVHWVERQAEKRNLKLREGAADRLILNTGANLWRMAGELDKLSLYAGPSGTVTSDQVDRLVARSTEQNVFLLIEEAVRMRLERAFSILYDLIRQKEEPIKIVMLLARQFRIMLQAKELARQGFSPQQIASNVGVHPYAVKVALEQGKRYDSRRLADMLSQLAELDYRMKSGAIDKLLGLEMFLLKLAQ